jgi:hypothetical protein
MQNHGHDFNQALAILRDKVGKLNKVHKDGTISEVEIDPGENFSR